MPDRTQRRSGYLKPQHSSCSYLTGTALHIEVPSLNHESNFIEDTIGMLCSCRNELCIALVRFRGFVAPWLDVMMSYVTGKGERIVLAQKVLCDLGKKTGWVILNTVHE